MMRLTIAILALFTVPTTVLAQHVRAPLQHATRPPLPALALDGVASAASASEPVELSQVLHVASGLLVGAWAGYMASQVAVGDWDDVGINRAGWTAGGAALGLTVGLALPGGGKRRAAAAPAPDRPPPHEVLTTRELRDAQGGSLYEIIRSLRPQWLQTRGTGSMRETPRGRATGVDEWVVQVEPGIETIRVYLDGSHLGGIDKLRTLDPGQVGEVRFLSPAEATQRWGGGHIHGAILVITAPSIRQL